MIILGIESSCDETAAAVVDGDGRVLSNVVSSQIPVHARYGGVIPELASRNHLVAIEPMVSEALERAGLGMDRITRLAVTQGPGLLGSLMVGLQYAKGLAFTRDLELVPLHHVEAHITAPLLFEGADHPHGPMEFPYVALAVSGGHTSLYLVSIPVSMSCWVHPGRRRGRGLRQGSQNTGIALPRGCAY
jgi:N6-L-threonylcarbamoyladenine synthase